MKISSNDDHHLERAFEELDEEGKEELDKNYIRKLLTSTGELLSKDEADAIFNLWGSTIT